IVVRNPEWTDRWRTLMARDLRYENADEIPEAFLKLDAVRNVSVREDGHVRAAVGTTTIEAPKPNGGSGDAPRREQATVSQEICTWTGESLGAPSMHDDENKHRVEVCGDYDLAIARAVDSPTDGRRPPPLREGRSYVFGARAYFLNGCGIPLKDAFHR